MFLKYWPTDLTVPKRVSGGLCALQTKLGTPSISKRTALYWPTYWPVGHLASCTAGIYPPSRKASKLHDMQLPQSIIQSLFVRTVHFMTIGMAILLLGMVPVGASAATSQLAYTPTNLRFGAVVVGQTETLLATLTNNGQSSVTVSGIAVGKSEFTTSNVSLPLVLLAGQSVDLSVSFTPTAMGWTGGTIKFSSNASNAALRLNVAGTGVSSQPVTASPSTVSFGQVAIGTISTVPVVLTNARSWKVALSSLQTTGGAFSMSGPSFPLTLGAGQSVAVNVAFSPQSAGTTGGELFVSGPRLAIPLTGTGTAPGQLTSNLGSLNFANVPMGSSHTQSVTLTNSGGSGLTVSHATLTGTGFTLSGLALPLTLGAGQSATFSIVFAPQSAGSASGNLAFASNASNPAMNLPLSGNTALVAPPADVLEADVVVDGSETVSETGMDDLAAAKNIYSSASAPESDRGLYPDWNLISSEFVMKRMRNINGLGDCALDGTGNLTGCSRLNNDLQNIKYGNLTPHVVVGQWAPSSIGGNPLQWGATQWAQYDALCYAIVNYVANQYGGTGFSEALFEVENEIDITTDPMDLWLTRISSVPQGDPSRFTQFDTVYSHWANAVNLVARQTPQKKIQIAGPATGFWTVYYGSGQIWQNQIVQRYAAQGIRLDVVSLHQYGGDITNLAKYAQSIRNTLIATGNPQTEIWVTEWGASSSSDSYFGAINASHQGAAWAIAFLLQALNGTVTGGSFLEVRDNQGHDTVGVNADMHEASWNHVKNSVEYPKAIANAFSMVDRMKGTRKSAAVSAAKPDLHAFASSDSSSASLIVANYNYLFDYANKNYSDLTTNETVTVAFENLPFSGPVTVDRYLIDAQTSNLNYWVAAGTTPPSVAATQLQKVESFSASSTGGTLTLPATPFGQSAVSLWIVHQ
jgi:Abnormal spindle-like microcephaly-assoc'd, ASPM-SPD-2-Hydin/Glycosyl hydrolase catalytic core